MAMNIREKILKERGLLERRPAPRKHTRLVAEIRTTVSGISKTPLMRYLEQKYKRPIEDILVSGSLSVVAKKLGNEVDTSTLSRWVKRFKLRYNANNLPSCKDCKHHQPICGLGVCPILFDMELWDLVPLKKEEVLG